MWTPDQTTNPWTQAASAGGTVGGQCVIHLSFQCPPAGYEGATVQSLTIHEAAAHYPDLDLSTNMHAGTASPLCDPNTAGVMWVYEDAPWASPGMHNGSHTITASMQYSWMSYVNGYPQGNTSTVSATITVDVENLLITTTSPANPQPIKWDPATMTSVPLSATTTCGYTSSQPWTLKIYMTDQTLVKTYTGAQIIGTGSTITASWDGTSDNSALYPTGAAPMGKGIYIFAWNVGTQGSGGDCDQDKSTLLTIGSGAAGIVFDDGVTLSTTVGYTLADAQQSSIAQGEIDVFILQTALTAQDTVSLTPDSLAPGAYNFPISVPSPVDGGLDVFLVSALDQHAAQDKGHRQRWALQRNNQYWGSDTVGFSHGDFYSLAKDWWNGMTPLGYKQLPEDSGVPNYQNEPTTAQMRSSMEYKTLVGNRYQKPLGAILFAGHGDGSGGYLIMAGALYGNGKSMSQRYLCTQSWYNDHQALASQQDCLILDTIVPTNKNTALSNIRLVVLIGCGQLQGSNLTESPLAADFCSHGAGCAVDVGMDGQTLNYASSWLTGWSKDPAEAAFSFLGLLKAGATFGYAARTSANHVNELYRRNQNAGGTTEGDVVGAAVAGNWGDYYRVRK